MSEATFTFRVDESLKNEFTQTAKLSDRTGAQLLREFMRDYVRKQMITQNHEQWFAEQVAIGIESANAGNLVSNEEVVEYFAKRKEQIREQIAKSTNKK